VFPFGHRKYANILILQDMIFGAKPALSIIMRMKSRSLSSVRSPLAAAMKPDVNLKNDVPLPATMRPARADSHAQAAHAPQVQH
jgi:hypothetical protein